MTDFKLIHVGAHESARLVTMDEDFGYEPSLSIVDAGGTSRGAYYPPASIVLYGKDNLRRLADLLGPYATQPKRWLPRTPEEMVHAAAGAKCACSDDQTCWRCVAQHILSLSGESK